MTPRRAARWRWVVIGGLVGGLFDITYAIVFSWYRSAVPPARILQSVASGLLGRPAYDGGTATALLGLGLHFGIAICAASVYWLASRRLPLLVARPVLAGAAFGALVFAFMNLVVIPLSRFPGTPAYPPVILFSGLLVHMGFGVPIALAARRASRCAEPTAPAEAISVSTNRS